MIQLDALDLPDEMLEATLLPFKNVLGVSCLLLCVTYWAQDQILYSLWHVWV